MPLSPSSSSMASLLQVDLTSLSTGVVLVRKVDSCFYIWCTNVGSVCHFSAVLNHHARSDLSYPNIAMHSNTRARSLIFSHLARYPR